MVYEIRLETNILQCFVHPENSVYIFLLSNTLFGVEIVAEHVDVTIILDSVRF